GGGAGRRCGGDARKCRCFPLLRLQVNASMNDFNELPNMDEAVLHSLADDLTRAMRENHHPPMTAGTPGISHLSGLPTSDDELRALLGGMPAQPSALPGLHTAPPYYFLPTQAVTTPPATFDVAGVRQHFPALHQYVNGKPLVWLDNAATTHKPQT